ncbi:sulfotransferase family protein [Amylibacter sp. SFDW26]|uniref:sulfotransferase family 2 domain-containing protein n=1 Tax=Amylibacter sp. SFDW26 TaxID=2652722 RepID=UPI0012613ECE|nr:sulfotransferase family 2 domain-containing protein [Amylibacter sp. SFDW26]KAB7613668.1 sulfotransferase family protein [Amylibacter sp. SFDW26]
MIISHGRKYIFVHIPKTGGTSLSLALENKAMKDDVLIGDTPKAKNRRSRLKNVKASGRLWKHARLTDVYGLITQEQIEQYFVFTIVRNPWDRVVSYYHWLKKQTFDHPAVKIAQSMPFADFLRNGMMQRSFKNDAAKSYVMDHDGMDRCNLYLRLEHLAQDAQILETTLGFKLGELPHDNKSQRDKEYSKYYDDTGREIIAAAFEEDINRFGYEF